MKKIFFIASALMLAGAGSSAWAQQIKEQVPYVEVNSRADTSVMPNEFLVAISISEEPTKGKTTIAELERSVARALDAAGVDVEKQLVITDQSNTGGKRKNIYQYKKYELKLTDPETVEAVFDELQTNGISKVSLSRSTRSDEQELRTKMRIKAIQYAQQTAAELAEAIGQRTGKAIYIGAYTQVTRQLGYATTTVAAGVRAKNSDIQEEPRLKLQFQDGNIQEGVTVRFALE